MKRNFLFGLTLLASVLFTACSTDDTADITINNTTNNGNGTTTGQTINISGTYTSDLTLDPANTYMINGSLIMAAGTTLTIPAGTTVYALAGGADVYVAISMGAKIMAEGTASNPIVFTSSANSPAAGDWGGLILLGDAPINSTTGTNTSTSEIGGLPYGGTDTTDDSGVLRYVRVEYSGGSADGQTENNGISLYGVGNGTTVDYVQAYEGLDDGIEFFGGTVNASHVVVVNAQDDSVDWTEGYSGTLTDVYIKHGTSHDKGIEADGYNTDIGLVDTFYSNPSVNNLTIVGNGSGTSSEAIRLRVGTKGIFNNVVLNGYGEGFDIDDTETGNGVVADELQISDITFTDITLKVKNDTGVSFTEADFITSGDGNGTETQVNTWGTGWAVGL